MKIKSMIDISQQLLSGDDKSFSAGIKGFPRSSMGEIARDALFELTSKNDDLTRQLERFDEDTESQLDPSKQTMTNELRQQASGMSLNDILVESACIETGKEIFVEKIAVYNASREDAVTHLETYFGNNQSLTGTPATDNEPTADETDAADADDAADATVGDEQPKPTSPQVTRQGKAKIAKAQKRRHQQMWLFRRPLQQAAITVNAQNTKSHSKKI